MEDFLHVHVLRGCGALKGPFTLGLLQLQLIDVLIAEFKHAWLIAKRQWYVVYLLCDSID